MSQDISVAYFGLDWNAAEMTIEQLRLKINQLQKDPTSASFLTLVIPHHLIKDLYHLEADLEAHSEAVLRGRTNRKQREHIR